MKNNKGFTLMELLIVVIIIVGFAAFAYPSYVTSIERARASEAVNMLATIQGAQQKHFVHYEEYGRVYHDINDFQPAIANWSNFEDGCHFTTEFFDYALDGCENNNKKGCAVARRINKDGELADKGYMLIGCYLEDFIRCYVLNESEDGDKICSSLTDLAKENDYYRIR